MHEQREIDFACRAQISPPSAISYASRMNRRRYRKEEEKEEKRDDDDDERERENIG